MNKTDFALRIGVCTAVIGLTILLATTAISVGGTTSVNFMAPPNANSDVNIVAPLFSGSCEIRVSVSRAFKGTLYMFDYQGMEELLTKSTRAPILEENITGSTLIDFDLTGKGAYMIIVESHVSSEATGTVGLVQKEGIDQDLVQNSEVILATGIVIAIPAAILKITRSRRPRQSPKP